MDRIDATQARPMVIIAFLAALMMIAALGPAPGASERILLRCI
jgi:hypothetical protein